MHETNSVKVPIPVGVKLYVGQFPKTHEEDAYISRVHMPVELEFGFIQWSILEVTLLMQWEFWENIFQNQGNSFRQM